MPPIAAPPRLWHRFAMLGFRKKHKARQRLIAAIQEEAKRTRAHLAAQALFAMEQLGQQGTDIWRDPYTRGYVYGAFAALLEGTPAADDEKLSRELIESGFVSFSANAFAIRESEAHDVFASLLTRSPAASLRHAIGDGRTDGLQMRQGMPALLWLAHLAERPAAR